MRFGLLLLCLLPLSVPLVAQESPLAPYCQKIGKGLAHGTQFTAACEFVESLHYRLPNFLCTENIERYEIPADNRIELRDKISAQVTHTASGDTYNNLLLNGKPVNVPMSDLLGMWSVGEFSGDLEVIFEPQSEAQFQFVKKVSWQGAPAYLFAFQVPRKYNDSWSLSLGGHVTHPGLKGKLLIAVQDSRVLRLEVEADELTPDDYLRRFAKTIDYSVRELGDGSQFVLPSGSESNLCSLQSHCSRSLATFQNCRKFAAKSRIVTDVK